jgi:hypothetical protein
MAGIHNGFLHHRFVSTLPNFSLNEMIVGVQLGSKMIEMSGNMLSRNLIRCVEKWRNDLYKSGIMI